MKQQIINPFNDVLVGEVQISTEDDVRDAVARASAAGKTYARMPAWQRAEILSQAAVLVEKESESLARLIVLESGKPIRYARGEVKRCVETLVFAADAARNLHGETIQMDAARGGVGRIGYYVRVPVGLVAAITPFNFPLNLVTHKVAPALACGCTIVLKPAPATPLTAIKLAEILKKAGLPDDVFSLVFGGANVGNWLTRDPAVAMITFTGSPMVAKAISRVAELRRTTFELGGNAAVVIDADVEITDSVIDRLIVGSFAYSGQICLSIQRLYVHRDKYKEVKQRLVEKVQALRLGDPMLEETDIGPVITEAAGARILEWVDEAIQHGAELLTGRAAAGRMVKPTLLENVPPTVRVMSEEVFGPVLCLNSFENFEEALAAVNDSQFGLQAGVYTTSIGHAMHAAEVLEVGGVIINDAPIFRVDQMPYGGVKNSGVGREGPRFAIEDMTTIKMVVINTAG